VEELVAHPNFRLLATMNPGGDFGKKELSPALRNRFTEVWVPAITNLDDLRSIVQDRLPHQDLRPLAEPLLLFWQVGRARKDEDLAADIIAAPESFLLPYGQVNRVPTWHLSAAFLMNLFNRRDKGDW
jgi:midasin (ATPase involved in ribosome maturation)